MHDEAVVLFPTPTRARDLDVLAASAREVMERGRRFVGGERATAACQTRGQHLGLPRWRDGGEPIHPSVQSHDLTAFDREYEPILPDLNGSSGSEVEDPVVRRGMIDQEPHTGHTAGRVRPLPPPATDPPFRRQILALWAPN